MVRAPLALRCMVRLWIPAAALSAGDSARTWKSMTVDKTALIVGGTGLVGGHCLRLLVQQPAYTKVVALLRRPAPIEDARLSQRIVDFDRLEGADFAGVSDVFCALGTTMTPRPAPKRPSTRSIIATPSPSPGSPRRPG